ncbi:hypothetical protein VTK73DRAFT_1754 [Phialemonium thermophilum]|uniref:Uncharacterized protein n=1 Tax=Phialemonium thermophilum TaxID=223376 RepID=A0ABR3X8M9_9PEZI
MAPNPPVQKSVVITGGASGIGLAMAEHFASAGHRVAILDLRGVDVAADLATRHAGSGGTVTFRQCDVTSWKEQSAAFADVFREHGGKIDVVMANAGISEGGVTSAVDLREEEPSEPRLGVVNVNLIGVIYTVKLAAHYMNKGGQRGAASRGTIVCTASNAGLYPFPTAPLYAATKAGVIALVRSLAPHLAPVAIQINALAPAVLETNIAPNKDLFKNMRITPMSTLIRGVAQFVDDPKRTGEVAEIHGNHVTTRHPHDIIDEDSAYNLRTFWGLGYA